MKEKTIWHNWIGFHTFPEPTFLYCNERLVEVYPPFSIDQSSYPGVPGVDHVPMDTMPH